MAVGDYRIDYSVKFDPKAGQSFRVAPEGHHRRCQSKCRGRDVQCSRWALRGQNFCPYHIRGRDKRVRGRGAQKLESKLGTLYRNKVGGKLRDLLDEISAKPREDRLSLLEEIDLCRMLAVRSLEAFDLAHSENSQASAALKAATHSHLSRSIHQVKEVMSAYAKMEAIAPDRLTAQQIKSFADDVEKILLLKLGDDPRAIEILDEIQNIRLPDVSQPVVNIVID